MAETALLSAPLPALRLPFQTPTELARGWWDAQSADPLFDPLDPATHRTPILIDAGPSGPNGWHGIESFMRCPQLWAWGEARRREGGSAFAALLLGASDEDLVLGSLVHVGFAHLVSRTVVGKELEAAFLNPEDAVEAAAVGLGPGATRALIEQAHTVVRTVGPFALSKLLHQYEVLGVEGLISGRARGEVVLSDGTVSAPVDCTSRIDLVVRDRSTGKVHSIDWKTCSRLIRATGLRYTLSGQLSLQRRLCRMTFGDWYGSSMVGLILKVPPYGFELVPSPPAPGVDTRIIGTIIEAVERRRAMVASGRSLSSYPRVPTEQTCVTVYGPCPAAALCQWEV